MSAPASRAAAPAPATFEFSAENKAKIAAIVARYPAGRQASAVLALLDLAQRQIGWVPPAAIETIARTLDMAPMRVTEVASFFTMVNKAPVGKYLLQVCGTTPCWLRNLDAVYAAIREECGIGPGETSQDGLFTCVEVECLGACVNAPVVQINDDFFEDLTRENFAAILRRLKAGEWPKPGPQAGRHSSEPEGGPTTLRTTTAG